MEQQQDLLQEEITNQYKRRRQLLPWWIKIFIWIFLVFGAIVPIGLIAAAFGYNFQIALYGLETNQPLSMVGLLLCILFLLKGIVAYGLWTEKDWAVNLGIADAIIGIVICCFMMFVYPFVGGGQGGNINLRLELILLIPYFIRLRKAIKGWSSISTSII